MARRKMSLAHQPLNTPRLARVLNLQLAQYLELVRRRMMNPEKGARMLSCVALQVRRIRPSFCHAPTGEFSDATEFDLQAEFFFHTAPKSIHYAMDLSESRRYDIRAMSLPHDEPRNSRERESWEGHSTVYLQGMARLPLQRSISIRNPMFPVISQFMVNNS
jgi:hypothetical protein